MLTFNKIDEDFVSLKYLGFKERKVYQVLGINNEPIIEILSDLLKSEVYFKTQNITSYKEKPPKHYKIRTNCAFTDKIEIEDFEQFTFIEYQKRIEEIKKETDWGEDLAIFIELIEQTENWIVENCYEKEQIFFINSQSIPVEKLIENNYYTYFMTTIIISNSELIIINHGGD